MMNIERIFQECSPNALGEVRVLHLVEWISTNLKSEMNFQVGDRALEDFHELLDPDAVNPLIDQTQFESCMKIWLSGKVGQVLQEESRVRLDSSNSSILNYSSGTLETSNHSFAAEDVFSTCCCHEELELRKKNSELESKVEKLSSKAADLQKMYNSLSEEYEGVRKLYIDCLGDLEKGKVREHGLLRKCADLDRLLDEFESKEAQCLLLERKVLNLTKKLSDKDDELRCFICSKDDNSSEVESLKTALEESKKMIQYYSNLWNDAECEKNELINIVSENADKIMELKRRLEMQSNFLSDISGDCSVEPVVDGVQDVLPDECVCSLYDEMKSIESGHAQSGHNKETQCNFVLDDNSQAGKLFETSVVFVETAPRPSPFINLKFNLPYGSGEKASSHRDGDDGVGLVKEADFRTPRRAHLKKIPLAQTSTPIHHEMNMDSSTQDVDVSHLPSVDGDDFLESAAWFSKRVATAATMTDMVERLSVACQVSSWLRIRPKQGNVHRPKWQSVGMQTETSSLSPDTANISCRTEAVGRCRSRKRCRISQDFEPKSEMSPRETGWSTQTELSAKLSSLESQNCLVDRQISRRSYSELPVDNLVSLAEQWRTSQSLSLLKESMSGSSFELIMDANTSNCKKSGSQASENSMPTCSRNLSDQFEAEGMQIDVDTPGGVRVSECSTEPHGDSRLAPVVVNVGGASSLWGKILYTLFLVILMMVMLLSCMWVVLYSVSPYYLRSCRSSVACLDAFPFIKVSHFGPPPT